MLPAFTLKLVWRRVTPTLRIRDPHKNEKMTAAYKIPDKCSAKCPVFCEDEVEQSRCGLTGTRTTRTCGNIGAEQKYSLQRNG